MSIRAALLGAFATAAAMSGCGGGGATEFPGTGPPQAGGGGELVYAIPPTPSALDPLGAAGVSARWISRQIFEPLVFRLDGPYGRRSNAAGIVLSARPSGDFRVWSLQLRPGVRFQDGRLLDASAVLVNSQRWRTSDVGRRLLPGLIAADGPRPDLVRFVFSAPIRDLDRRLGDPRLGLISPAALLPRSGIRASLLSIEAAGSGPFEFSGRRDGAIELQRNAAWWGTAEELGPALDRLAFPTAESARDRLKMLENGSARVAGDLTRPAARRLQADPLFTAVGVGGAFPLGFERSVKGIDGSRPTSLSGVWLASLAG